MKRAMLSCGQGEQEPRAPHDNVQGAREGRRNLILPEIDMTTVRRRLINSGWPDLIMTTGSAGRLGVGGQNSLIRGSELNNREDFTVAMALKYLRPH